MSAEVLADKSKFIAKMYNMDNVSYRVKFLWCYTIKVYSNILLLSYVINHFYGNFNNKYFIYI